jgi:STE24 endopeptidase
MQTGWQAQMDERRIKKYFFAGYAIKFFQLAIFSLFIGAGIIYLFFHAPMLFLNDYSQITIMTAMIVVAYLLAAFVATPLDYRIDREYGRTTLRFRSYLSYKLRSRLVFLIPFALLLLLYTSFWFLVPVDSDFATLLTFVVTLVLVLIIGFIMPRIYGSALRRERIEDQSLIVLIRDLADKMGIKGKFTGAYHVPVRGFKIVNAAQLGFARRQARVYLIGDIEQVLNRNEIQAVVAHEFAHLKLRHILKLTLLLLALMLVAYSAFTIVANILIDFLFVNNVVVTDELIFSIIILVGYILSFIAVYLVVLKLHRRFETEADLLAARVTNPTDLATSLEKLADYNLVPMEFPKIIGILKGHPSMKERIDRLKRLHTSFSALE